MPGPFSLSKAEVTTHPDVGDEETWKRVTVRVRQGQLSVQTSSGFLLRATAVGWTREGKNRWRIDYEGGWLAVSKKTCGCGG